MKIFVGQENWAKQYFKVYWYKGKVSKGSVGAYVYFVVTHCEIYCDSRVLGSVTSCTKVTMSCIWHINKFMGM